MERTTMYIPRFLNKKARALALATGLSQSEICRAAVRDYVEREPAQLPCFVGMVDKPDAPQSSEIREYVRERRRSD